MNHKDLEKYVAQSVLCWLATASAAGEPNVSPKEIFLLHADGTLLIANIASPGSLRNIQENPAVCVSFLDVLVQKGLQLKGTASVVSEEDDEFAELSEGLIALTGGKFPFRSIFRISPERSKPIISPRYRLFPDTTEEEQIRSAKEQYGVGS